MLKLQLQNQLLKEIRALCASPDGHVLASGDREGNILMWDPNVGEIISMVKAHEKHVRTLAISGDSSWLVTGSEDHTVKIWSLKDPGDMENIIIRSEPVLHAIFHHHTAAVWAVAISPNGKRLVSASMDGTAVVLPMPRCNRPCRCCTGASFEKLSLGANEHGSFLCAAWAPDNTHFATAGLDHCIHVWDVDRKVGILVIFGACLCVHVCVWVDIHTYMCIGMCVYMYVIRVDI
jgi:WD40 repeat protein